MRGDLMLMVGGTHDGDLVTAPLSGTTEISVPPKLAEGEKPMVVHAIKVMRTESKDETYRLHTITCDGGSIKFWALTSMSTSQAILHLMMCHAKRRNVKWAERAETVQDASVATN